MKSPPPSPLPRSLSLVGFAGACALLALLLWPLDGPLLRLLNPDDAGPLDDVLRTLADALPRWLLTASYVAGPLALLLGRRAATRRAGAVVLVAPLVGAVLVNLLKRGAGRLRPLAPENGIEGLRRISDLVDDRSFPSGHVATATLWALGWVLLLAPLRGRHLILLLIPAMMWNRVALAVHHPSDVLAGAAAGALVVLVLQQLVADRELRLGGGPRGLVLLFAVLALGWAWQSPAVGLDPVTRTPVEGLSMRPRPLRLALEPFVGPPLELAWTDEPARYVLGAFLLGVLILTALVFLPRGARRATRLRNACLFIALASTWVLLMVHVDLPADRFGARRPGVFLDPHVHGSDPVDGALPVEFVLRRLRRRGVDVVALTNHDAPPPSPEAIPGSEWSGFRHPTQTWIHLVILGGRGAVQAALGEVEALAAVRAAKAAGATVIVAHYWRTARVMRAEGHRPPTPEEFVAAGVDGFEVANRQPTTRPEDVAVIREIDALCRRDGLLRLAASDDHGRMPAGSPCITFVPGEFPEDPGLRRRDVLEHLRHRGRVEPVIFDRPAAVERSEDLVAAPLAAWTYARALSLPGRLSWMLWGGLAVFLLGGLRRSPRDPAGP